ncbi:MAG: alpha/beta hydrolase [Alphaproteobacteria bacterium]|nr:alpha/beta hydrolase [Alphaproteobacteria bacterium]
MNDLANSAVSLGTIRTPLVGCVSANGADLRYYEWCGEGPTILMAHGTGFHARCWDAVIELLGDAHVVAVDHRGHGQSSKTAPYAWSMLGADMAAIVTTLNLQDVIGVGHSLGAHIMLQAAFAETARFRSFLAIDPIIFPPEIYATAKPPETVHPASRRRDLWASPEAMFERFKDREPFCRWRPRVLRDYCEYGLARAPGSNGDYHLACPPAVEARIYDEHLECDATGMAATLDLPVTVLRAGVRPLRPGASKDDISPFWPGLAAHMRNATDVFLPERAHAIPMEDPDLVTSYILQMRNA